MKYRNLGSTDIRLSLIGVGTHQFGGDWGIPFSQKEVNSIMSTAQQNGINIVDTAPCYGPDNLSEKLIRKYITNNRDEWFISTKFGQKYNISTKKEISDFTLPNIEKQFQQSLKNLKTDYIDLYQFHSGNNLEFDNEDLWAFLHNQVDNGAIKALGVSFSHNLVNDGDTHQLDGVKNLGLDFVQLVYNRITKVAEEKFLPFCKKNKIGVLSRVPLAKGFLSGNYQPGHRFSKDDHRHKFGNTMNDLLLKKVDKIKKKEVPPNINMSEWSLGWCLNNKAITSVIPGCKNMDQVKSNASSLKYLKNVK